MTHPRSAASWARTAVSAVARPRRPRVLDGPDVVDPAVAVEVEGERGRQALAAVAAGDHDAVGLGVDAGHEAGPHVEALQEAHVVRPRRERQVDVRAREAQVADGRRHRTGRLGHRVAAGGDRGPHRLVALVTQAANRSTDAEAYAASIASSAASRASAGRSRSSRALLKTSRSGPWGKTPLRTPGPRITAAPRAPAAHTSHEATRVSAPRW